jgi:hypothetical protein
LCFLLYILASKYCSLMPSAFSSPIKHFSKLHVSFCLINFYLTDVFSFSYFKYWFPLLILINTLKSLLYYHCQVLTILTFSHHVHTTQIFSVKRMQHTAKQRLLFFSLRSQSKWIDNIYIDETSLSVQLTLINAIGFTFTFTQTQAISSSTISFMYKPIE